MEGGAQKSSRMLEKLQAGMLETAKLLEMLDGKIEQCRKDLAKQTAEKLAEQTATILAKQTATIEENLAKQTATLKELTGPISYIC